MSNLQGKVESSAFEGRNQILTITRLTWRPTTYKDVEALTSEEESTKGLNEELKVAGGGKS